MFRAPWPPIVLAALLLALFGLQALAGVDRVADAFALVPAQVARGRRLAALLTFQFVHLGWAHAGLNALAIVAFGSGVARQLGTRARGAATFFAFYLGCGVVAGLAETAAHPHGMELVVGASGAASGLVGAVSRLQPGERRLLPFLSAQALAMAAAWTAGNVVLGLTGLDFAAGGAPIAWEAHLGGYAAGLFAFGPACAVAHLREDG
ncbi:MAG: rhomboid family intramembrane serine protease [Caulobacteraceae bacterium]|nr:rhomboid family intramembrane serine protease [Caulobacter sp.]